MQWFYAKDGQQLGPVEFSEIERLHAAGEITGETLVWQQGTASWVKLHTLLAGGGGLPPANVPPLSSAPATVSSSPAAPGTLPDHGDILCWGILAILIPCVGSIGYIVLIVLHVMELVAARKLVEEKRLQPSDYSGVHPALYVLGLLCCGIIFYPLFMFWRNKSGYFKPQPYAVWVAIGAVILALGVNVVLQVVAGGMQAAAESYGN